MKNILLFVCLIGLAIGHPIPDSNSDTSENVEVNSKSSESSLQSSEQQYDSSEEIAHHQNEEVSGGQHEDNGDQDHVPAATDSIDFEGQLTDVDEGAKHEDTVELKESTEHPNGSEEDDEYDDESGSHENKFDKSPEVSQSEDHLPSATEERIGERKEEKTMMRSNGAESENKDENKSHDSDDVDTEDEDENDDYEDNVMVKAGNSKEDNQDCGNESKENNDDINSSLKKSHEKDSEEMQNDDSNISSNHNSDSTLNSEAIRGTSSEKNKRLMKKKAKQIKTNNGHTITKSNARKIHLDVEKPSKLEEQQHMFNAQKSPENYNSKVLDSVEIVLQSKPGESKISASQSHEDIHSAEEPDSKDVHSPEDIHSPEDTHSQEDSIEDIPSTENSHSKESSEDTHSLKDAYLTSSKHDTTPNDDLTESKESIEDIVKSQEDITQSEEDKTKSIENSRHSKSKEILQFKQNGDAMEKTSKSASVEDEDGSKSTQDKSESMEDVHSKPNSEEDSKDTDWADHERKLHGAGTKIEQDRSSESTEVSNSLRLMSIVLGNSSLDDSKSSSKSAEINTVSKDNTEEDRDSSDNEDKESITAEDSESQSRESGESIEVRPNTQSSESEDVSKESLSSEFDSRRLMFGLYQRKAIGNDNDCQDGY